VQRVTDGAPPSNAIEVMACDTLDNYWRNFCGVQLKKVDMIIMDVEGAELDVLKGAQAIFDTSPNLAMMAECNSKLNEVSALLKANGFAFFEWKDAASLSLKEISMKRGNIFVLRQK
jgi:FkbM family methyltransferase